MKNSLKTLALAVTVAVMMVGCGNRVPANPPIEDSAASSPAPSDAPSIDPNATPSVNPAPANPAYNTPTTGSLTVAGIAKKKKGLIFKKLEVSGTVTNTSNQPMSGTLKVQFKKSKGLINKQLVDDVSKTQDIAVLQPNQSVTFTITSDKSEDDAEITVDTAPGAAPVAAAAPAAGTASAMAVGAHQTGPYGY